MSAKSKSVSITQTSPKVLQTLKENAYAAQKRAYSPYSKFKIGSAIEDSVGNIFSGCNIENSSYGATVCAERVAIWSGIAAGMKLPLKKVFVVSSTQDQWPPCGQCRQVIAEFCDSKTEIYFGNNKGQFKKIKFSALLPEMFNQKFL